MSETEIRRKDIGAAAAEAGSAVCNVCFRHCVIPEGRTGACRARRCEGGRIVCSNYGWITSIALDPIEKKPLHDFYPGSRILSVGSFGCNLKCAFCQNYTISMAGAGDVRSERYTPEELSDLASRLRPEGNIGIAFTYNEPLVGWEFVRDTARLVHSRGMKNVLVTNGTASVEVLEELLPYIDAMNIDLKAFSEDFYRNITCGNFEMTKEFIRRAVSACHVELTTLLITGKNDREEEIRAESAWIAGLNHGRGRQIPLHLTRYFPRYQMRIPATDVNEVYELADAAREYLDHVYIGNC